jgi:hypothetical protein
MAYTPYDYDIYISYSDVDNKPAFLLSDEGWVDVFCKKLDAALNLKIGSPGALKIWRDTRSDRHDLDDKSLNALKKSAVFLALVSPAYLSSDVCRKELKTFSYDPLGAFSIPTRVVYEPRLFKLLLNKIPDDSWPLDIRNIEMVAYRFYDESILFSRVSSASDPRGEFFDKQLGELADEIYKTLQSLRGDSPLIARLSRSGTEMDQPSARISQPPIMTDLDDTWKSSLTTKQSSVVFISYRREATGPYARLFYNLLAERLGKENVFLDVINIKGGDDFVKVIKREAASCSALIELIHKDWLDAKDEEGRRRLDDPEDFVRLEISIALGRNIPVIPVLIDGASMPRRKDLPAALADFSQRNFLEVSYSRLDSDVDELVKALEKHLHY